MRVCAVSGCNKRSLCIVFIWWDEFRSNICHIFQWNPRNKQWWQFVRGSMFLSWMRSRSRSHRNRHIYLEPEPELLKQFARSRSRSREFFLGGAGAGAVPNLYDLASPEPEPVHCPKPEPGPEPLELFARSRRRDSFPEPEPEPSQICTTPHPWFLLSIFHFLGSEHSGRQSTSFQALIG